MSTPVKCPHCGADISPYEPGFLCGTGPTFADQLGPVGKSYIAQSDLCRERTAHAETRKELEKLRAAVRDCLNEPSNDGRPSQLKVRAKLRALVTPEAKEGK